MTTTYTAVARCSDIARTSELHCESELSISSYLEGVCSEFAKPKPHRDLVGAPLSTRTPDNAQTKARHAAHAIDGGHLADWGRPTMEPTDWGLHGFSAVAACLFRVSHAALTRGSFGSSRITSLSCFTLAKRSSRSSSMAKTPCPSLFATIQLGCSIAARRTESDVRPGRY